MGDIVTSSSTSLSSLSSTTTLSSLCTDAPLPMAWSGGGVHTCATYEQHGGLAYCQHVALKAACCFCKTGTFFSALSAPGNIQQPIGITSRANFFCPHQLPIAV